MEIANIYAFLFKVVIINVYVLIMFLNQNVRITQEKSKRANNSDYNNNNNKLEKVVKFRI